MRIALATLLALAAVGPASAQAPPAAVPLVEAFSPKQVVQVTVESSLSGRLAIPEPPAAPNTPKGQPVPPKVVPLEGRSLLVYDEKVLPTVEADTGRSVRQYRQVTFSRLLGDREQKAEVRAEVRRMVVLRGAKGKKVPFSPDGPLTLHEIEVVRADLFSLALVPGLLPAQPVRPGDQWRATDAAVSELTDYETVESNKLNLEFAGVVTLDGKRLAKITLAGTVSGATEDGPSRQSLSGLAYFDLDINRLTYLKITGKSRLLGPNDATVGEVTGTFTLRRTAVEARDGLTDESLKDVGLVPTDANTLLLYDDAARGVRFRYPRRWRIGVTDGDRVTVDEANNLASVSLTLTPAGGVVPAALDVLADAKAQAEKVGTVTAIDAPSRVREKPTALDRFGLSVDAKPTPQSGDKGAKFRYEYSVVNAGTRGAVVRARFTEGAAQEALKAQAAALAESVEFFPPNQ